jgi:4-amino-4-deoxychorismate lyase
MPAQNRKLLNGVATQNLSSLPESFFYHGLSVFTTLLCLKGQTPWLGSHLERLQSHAGALGLFYPGHDAFIDDVAQLSALGVALRIRLTIGDNFRLSEASLFRTPDPAIYEGVEVAFTSFQVHPNWGHLKTGNYLPYRLAQAQANKQGAFEGLLLDSQGNVVDGSRTSLLLYQSNTLTALEGGLDGITRRRVLDEAKQMGVQTDARLLKQNDLQGQLLLAGSGVGLVPVGAPIDAQITELIQRFRLSGQDL